MHNITSVVVSTKNVIGHFYQRHSAKQEVRCTHMPQVALVTTVPSESESSGKINDVACGQHALCMEQKLDWLEQQVAR